MSNANSYNEKSQFCFEIFDKAKQHSNKDDTTNLAGTENIRQICRHGSVLPCKDKKKKA